MIKHVLYKLGALRAALAVGVGVPMLIASSALAQVGGTAPTPANAGPTPATATGAGNPTDSAIADSAADTNPAAGAATTDRVVVTGSYIPTAETESALPVTVYTATVMQKQGANTAAESLRQLPSFVGNTLTENDSNGGNGSAAVNLRALGSGNTLTLVNGRRAFIFEDVNGIPIGALSRTEVLKDGASAIYGSDAVAGVVNFVLLNGPGEAPYEGAELDLLYGNTTDRDARVLQGWIRGGVATDKVSVAAAAMYYDVEDIFSVDREISRSPDHRAQGEGAAALPNNASTGAFTDAVYGDSPLGLGGFFSSSPTFAGRVTAVNQPGGPNDLTLSAADRAGRGNNRIIINSTGVASNGQASYRPVGAEGFVPKPGQAAAATYTGDMFNFRRFTPAIPGRTTYSTYISGRYKVFGEALQVYGDMLYTKRQQDNGLAPSPFTIPGGPPNYRNAEVGINFPAGATGNAQATARQRQIIQQSPFNPFANSPTTAAGGLAAAPGGNNLQSISYRLVQELGLRRVFNDFDYYRWTAGANGNFTLADNGFANFLGYDVGMTFNRGDFKSTTSGDATRSGVLREIIAGNFNPFIGQAAPTAGVAPTYVNGVQTGTAAYDNTAAIERSRYTSRQFTYTYDFLADAKVFGNLIPNLYQGGIGFNLGYEYRHSRAKTIQSAIVRSGDTLGFNPGSPDPSTHQTVESFFGELQIPIITSAMNIPGVRSLELQVAGRYEEFNNKSQFGIFQTGTADQPDIPLGKLESQFDNNGDIRLSLRYQPIADLTLRASFGESFLSPTPAQLFAPPGINFPQLFDPLTGVFAQPPGGVLIGGNRVLTPETTETYTAGLVYTPKWLPGFTVTTDLYQLYTKNVILSGNQFAQIAVTANAAAGGGNDAFVTRTDGAVFQVLGTNQNAGKRLVNGMDVTATYQLPWTQFGTFTISTGYNYFFTWKAEPAPGAGSLNFLGDFSGSLPLSPGAIPYHKGFLRGEYEWKGLNFIATTNYISSYNDDPAAVYQVNSVLVEQTNAGDTGQAQYNVYRRVSDYITLDLQLSYEFIKPEAEPAAGFSKDAKGGKAMQTEVAGVEQGSFFQRMLWGTKIRVGVVNAFDRQPPTTLGAFNDNYDTSLYNIRNRYYYIGLNKKF